MRQVENPQIQIGQEEIAKIRINPKSRDDIPKVLRGLQEIYTTDKLRTAVFELLGTLVPEKVDPKNGRPGMELWKLFVMGILRVNLNIDYDRLHELVNEHRTIRQMLGHGIIDEDYEYQLQTLKDNVRLLTPDVLDKVNQVIVKYGHSLLKKKKKR